MSAHSQKSRMKDCKFPRTIIQVGHMFFEIVDHPTNGQTFAVYVNDPKTHTRPAQFSGHVQNDMGSELRRVAAAFDQVSIDKK